MFLTPLFGYFVLLVVCVIFSFSVNCLVAQWVCLELNMLAVIPLLVSSGKNSSGEISVKYFVSQSVASLLFICSLLLSQELTLVSEFIYLVLLFKLALPPFQSWLLSMLEGLGLAEIWILFTVQKMIPLMILSQLSMGLPALLISGLAAASFMLIVINSVLSLNLLLFISSIVNTIWVASITQVSLIWLVYMIIYSYMLLVLVFSLSTLKIYKINDLFGVYKCAALMVAAQLFNLGGGAPFSGVSTKVNDA